MKETKFKQTEVGMIPIDWEVKKLGHLCSLWGRIGFRGYTREDLVEAHKGAITFSPSDIHNQKIDLENCTYISLKKYEESPEIKVFNGDIIFGKTASIGKCALVEGLSEKATINPQFVLMNNFKCNNRFLYYQLIDKPFQTNIWTICGGSTIPTMSQEKLKQQQIAFPSTYAEQTAIANTLSDVDTLITNLEKLIAKKKNIKQGAMQQLLTGKKRLPGFAPAKPTYKQTELGKIPTDWEFEVFGKLVSIYRGGSPRPIEAYITTNPSGINWIKIGDVEEGAKYITSTQERIIPEGKSKSREVHKGDFILSNSMSFGRPYILKVDGCIHDGWLTIQDYQDTFDTDFLYYMLSSEVVFNQYVSMAAGSSVQNLNKEKVAAVKLFYPPSKTEQSAIANVFSDMDTEIATLETKLAKYRKLKTGMMQQLLTGKIRLV